MSLDRRKEDIQFGEVLTQLKYINDALKEIKVELADKMEPRIRALENYQNTQKGYIALISLVGAIVGSGITIFVKWWKG